MEWLTALRYVITIFLIAKFRGNKKSCFSFDLSSWVCLRVNYRLLISDTITTLNLEGIRNVGLKKTCQIWCGIMLGCDARVSLPFVNFVDNCESLLNSKSPKLKKPRNS